MKQEDIDLIERELKIKLPNSYKTNALKSVLSDKESFPNVYNSFLDDPEEIIKKNRLLREKGLQGKKWPINLFVIGFVGDNNYFFIDLDAKDKSYIYFTTDDRNFHPANIEKAFERYNI